MTDIESKIEHFDVFYLKDGAEIREQWSYDFNQMSVAQIAQIKVNFLLHDRLLKTLPATPENFTKATERAAYLQALGTLLLKFNKDTGKYEDYDVVTHDGKKVLSYIKGKDYLRLEECVVNFRIATGLVQNELMRQLNDLIQSMDEEGIPAERQPSILAAFIIAEQERPLLQKFVANFSNPALNLLNIEGKSEIQSTGLSPISSESESETSVE